MAKNILHEIAHFIEIEEHRCFKQSWGLNKGVWVLVLNGEDYEHVWNRKLNKYLAENPGAIVEGVLHDFWTPKHLLRECRVWSIQNQLGLGCGLPDCSEEFSQTMNFMPNSNNYKTIGKGLSLEEWAQNEISKVEFTFDELMVKLDSRREFIKSKGFKVDHNFRFKDLVDGFDKAKGESE